MKTYNVFKHCGDTYYTGIEIRSIKCGECGEKLEPKHIIETEQPISAEKNVETVNRYENLEEYETA